MNEIQKLVSSNFECEELPSAAFYHFDFALRFELGGEGNSTKRPLKRFIQAFDRARKITKFVFKDTPSIWILTANFTSESPSKKPLKSFRHCGFSKSDFVHFCSTPQNDKEYIKAFGTDLYRHWFAAKLKKNRQLDEVLWLALGAELGILPAVRPEVYIVDFDRKVLLYPYDDRGMDVIAMNKQTLLPLYAKRKSWLLEYDMPQMAATFES